MRFEFMLKIYVLYCAHDWNVNSKLEYHIFSYRPNKQL